MIRRGPVFIALLLATPGCASPAGSDAPLAPERIAALERRAQPPERLGLSLRRRPDGSQYLADARGMLPGARVAAPLLTAPFQPARFPVVRTRLNGRLVLALVDTGSTMTLIEEPAARRVGLAPIGPPLVRQKGQSLGGDEEYILALAAAMQIGGAEVRKAPFGIVDSRRGLYPLCRIEGYRVEAVLGCDFLHAFAWVSVDYPREVFRASWGGTYEPASGHVVASAPLVNVFGLPAVEATVGEGRNIRVVLDTGGDFGLWIPRGLAGRMKLPELADTTGTSLSATPGGEAVYKPIASRDVEFGGHVFEDVPAIAAMLNFGDKDTPYVLLGNHVLKDYIVSVDYGAKRVYLEKP